MSAPTAAPRGTASTSPARGTPTSSLPTASTQRPPATTRPWQPRAAPSSARATTPRCGKQSASWVCRSPVTAPPCSTAAAARDTTPRGYIRRCWTRASRPSWRGSTSRSSSCALRRSAKSAWNSPSPRRTTSRWRTRRSTCCSTASPRSRSTSSGACCARAGYSSTSSPRRCTCGR